MSTIDNGLLDKDGNPLYKGQSKEVSEVKNQPGLYVFPETGAQLITAPGSKGVTQADALVRQGWERRGPVPTPAELAEMRKKQFEADHAAGKTVASAPGLPAAAQQAQVNQVADLQTKLDAAEQRAAKAEKTAQTALEAATAAQAAAEAAQTAAAQAPQPSAPEGEPAASDNNVNDKNKEKK